MLFEIYRTSDRGLFEQPKPCKNAIKRTYRVKPWDFLDTMEEGVDWLIEINTLDELLDLRKEVGEELIIGDGTIEIYDTRRE